MILSRSEVCHICQCHTSDLNAGVRDDMECVCPKKKDIWRLEEQLYWRSWIRWGWLEISEGVLLILISTPQARDRWQLCSNRVLIVITCVHFQKLAWVTCLLGVSAIIVVFYYPVEILECCAGLSFPSSLPIYVDAFSDMAVLPLHISTFKAACLPQ